MLSAAPASQYDHSRLLLAMSLETVWSEDSFTLHESSEMKHFDWTWQSILLPAASIEADWLNEKPISEIEIELN